MLGARHAAAGAGTVVLNGLALLACASSHVARDQRELPEAPAEEASGRADRNPNRGNAGRGVDADATVGGGRADDAAARADAQTVDAGPMSERMGPPCVVDPDEPGPRVGLVVVAGGEVAFFATDGTLRTAFSFLPYPHEPSGHVDFTVAQRGDHILVSASSWGAGAAGPDSTCLQKDGRVLCPEWDRVVLLDLEGEVLWDKSFVGMAPSSRYGPEPHLGDEGAATLTGTLERLLVTQDGSEEALPDASLLAPPLAGPTLVVGTAEAGLPKQRIGLYRSTSGIELSDVRRDASQQVYFGAGVVALVAATLDATPVVAQARAEGVETLTAPLEVLGNNPVSVSGVTWLYAVDADAGLLRVDVLSGETKRFASVLPSGWRPMESFLGSSTGGVAVVARDDSQAQLWHSSDGIDWTPVGRSLGLVEHVDVMERAGTYSIHARGVGEFFEPTQQWPEADAGQAGELLNSSLQLVRPAAGVSVVLDPGVQDLTLSADGRCAAYRFDDVLEVRDIEGGAIVTTAQLVGQSAMAWVE